MHGALSRMSLLSAGLAALLLSGCATVDDVKKAQSTADQALSTAQSAQQAAQAAQQSADQNRSDISNLNQRVNDLEKHKGERG